MGETQNDEDAPPTEEEIKELWRQNRFNLWRQERFHRGLTINVCFIRAPELARYWDAPVPESVRAHAVAFTLTRRHVPVTSKYTDSHRWTTVVEIRGNGFLVESVTREGLN